MFNAIIFVYKSHKMKNLNLDNNFTPLGPSIEFETFTFNGGEPHIKIKAFSLEGEEVTISHRIQSFNDLGLVLLAKDALDRMGVTRINLIIPYFPAARQDRVMVVGEPLSVKVYANIINAAGFDQVSIFDPHSEVTPALLNKVKVVENYTFVKKVLEDLVDYTLISPDGGALKKIYKLSAFLGGKPVIECSKHRDVNTGKLKGFKVYADDFKNKTCVIVDDICDGGGTFLGLAKELKNKNAGDIILVVSHGIFSKGLDELDKHFTKIYTTDSFSTIDDPRLKQLKLENLL